MPKEKSKKLVDVQTSHKEIDKKNGILTVSELDGQTLELPYKPLKGIDPGYVYRLAKIHASYDEMAGVLLTTHKLLSTHFGIIIETGIKNGKLGLKRSMFVNANVMLDTGMQKFLATNYLNMDEKKKVEMENVEVSEKVEQLVGMVAEMFDNK